MTWRPSAHEGEIVGRQPANIQIAPSKTYPWYGTITDGVRGPIAITGGHRFTTQQQRGLIELGKDPVTIEAIEVRRESNDAEVWTPINVWRPVWQFACPVIGHRADGRTKVLAPNGSVKFIRPDGWATKPSLTPNTGPRW